MSPWFRPTRIPRKNIFKFSTAFLSTPRPVSIDLSLLLATSDPKELSSRKTKQRNSTKKPLRTASKQLWQNMTQTTMISSICKSEMWLQTKSWRLRSFISKNFLLVQTFSMNCIWLAQFILATWLTFLGKSCSEGSEIGQSRLRENFIGILLSSSGPAKR